MTSAFKGIALLAAALGASPTLAAALDNGGQPPLMDRISVPAGKLPDYCKAPWTKAQNIKQLQKVEYDCGTATVCDSFADISGVKVDLIKLFGFNTSEGCIKAHVDLPLCEEEAGEGEGEGGDKDKGGEEGEGGGKGGEEGEGGDNGKEGGKGKDKIKPYLAWKSPPSGDLPRECTGALHEIKKVEEFEERAAKCGSVTMCREFHEQTDQQKAALKNILKFDTFWSCFDAHIEPQQLIPLRVWVPRPAMHLNIMCEKGLKAIKNREELAKRIKTCGTTAVCLIFPDVSSLVRKYDLGIETKDECFVAFPKPAMEKLKWRKDTHVESSTCLHPLNSIFNRESLEKVANTCGTRRVCLAFSEAKHSETLFHNLGFTNVDGCFNQFTKSLHPAASYIVDAPRHAIKYCVQHLNMELDKNLIKEQFELKEKVCGTDAACGLLSFLDPATKWMIGFQDSKTCRESRVPSPEVKCLEARDRFLSSTQALPNIKNELHDLCGEGAMCVYLQSTRGMERSKLVDIYGELGECRTNVEFDAALQMVDAPRPLPANCSNLPVVSGLNDLKKMAKLCGTATMCRLVDAQPLLLDSFRSILSRRQVESCEQAIYRPPVNSCTHRVRDIFETKIDQNSHYLVDKECGEGSFCSLFDLLDPLARQNLNFNFKSKADCEMDPHRFLRTAIPFHPLPLKFPPLQPLQLFPPPPQPVEPGHSAARLAIDSVEPLTLKFRDDGLGYFRPAPAPLDPLKCPSEVFDKLSLKTFEDIEVNCGTEQLCQNLSRFKNLIEVSMKDVLGFDDEKGCFESRLDLNIHCILDSLQSGEFNLHGKISEHFEKQCSDTSVCQLYDELNATDQQKFAAQVADTEACK